jgi:hypothetical protein
MTRQPSSPREGYPHDVDLGKPMLPDEIGRVIHDNRHSPGLIAVLQLVRNSASQNVGAAHDMVAAGRAECGHLNLGGQQALTELFWNVVAAMEGQAEGAAEEQMG